MKLSQLAFLLGAVTAIPGIFGIVKPQALRGQAAKFPRSLPMGYLLMAVATVWFVFNLSRESIADYAQYKPFLLGGFALLGVLSCIYVKDYLAVRGLAVVFLLLAKLMVDSARWEPSAWRLVIPIWAYALVISGILFAVSPWKCRDLLNWVTASDGRLRTFSGLALVLAITVIALGVLVY